MNDNTPVIPESTNITLNLPNGVQASVVSLQSVRMTAREYIEHVFKAGEKPLVIAMNQKNLEEVISSIEDHPKNDSSLNVPGMMKAMSGTRITVSEALGDDNIAIYSKPATQMLGILSELHVLLERAVQDEGQE